MTCWRPSSNVPPQCPPAFPSSGNTANNLKGTRVKKVTSPRFALASLAAALALTGCATNSSYSSVSAPPAQTGFVSQEMGNTISSIEKSLQVLVDLERGDEGPRKGSALGMTVAGAAGPNASAVSMPARAGAETRIGQNEVASQKAQTQRALSTRVRLTWTGPADELLGELSRRVGFTFSESGSGQAPVVHINEKDATVEQILRAVSVQVDAAADVKVDTTQRKVILAYKTISTR